MRRRRWLASLDPGATSVGRLGLRTTTPADDAALVALLDRADPEAVDHAAEIATWRRVDGADDDASRVLEVDGTLAGACLVGRELGTPLVYELLVAPDRRRRGLGSGLLRASMAALAGSGATELAAWIGEGNAASEAVHRGAGFEPVTPFLTPAEGAAWYRGLQAGRLAADS